MGKLIPCLETGRKGALDQGDGAGAGCGKLPAGREGGQHKCEQVPLPWKWRNPLPCGISAFLACGRQAGSTAEMCRGYRPHMSSQRWLQGLNRCPVQGLTPSHGSRLPRPFLCLHALSLLFHLQFSCAQDPRHCGDVSAGEQTLVHRITKVNMLRPLTRGTITSAHLAPLAAGRDRSPTHQLPLFSTNPQPHFWGIACLCSLHSTSLSGMQPPSAAPTVPLSVLLPGPTLLSVRAKAGGSGGTQP